MNRLFNPRRESEPKNPLDSLRSEQTAEPSGGGFRRALLALGFAGLAYLAARRARRSGSAPSMDEVKETVGDVRSGDAFTIPIGEQGESDSAEEPAMGSGTTEGAIGNEPMPGEDLSSPAPSDGDVSDGGVSEGDVSEGEVTEGDVSEEDDSAQENAGRDDSDEDIGEETIEERTEENAHEEPTEPGEMDVDEEIAEDVIDENDDEESA